MSAEKVERMELDTYDNDKINFHTASPNGVTYRLRQWLTSTSTPLYSETAKAHVLDDTPSVFVIGKTMYGTRLLLHMAQRT